MITEDILQFFQGPVVGALATAGKDKKPTFTRLLGVTGTVGGSELRAMIPQILSEKPRADVSENNRVALTVADITNMKSRQFKGTLVRVEEASVEDMKIVDASFAVTVPPCGAFFGPGFGAGWDRFNVRPFVTLVIRAEISFDQTPGPSAGKEIA